MKMFRPSYILASLLGAAFCVAASAEEYLITANFNGSAETFTGFSGTNFTSDPALPSGGPTSADDVIIRGFYDYNAESVDVNSFTYVTRGRSLGGYGAEVSFKYNATVPFTIKAKNISFLNNDVDINDSSYDKTAEFLNIFVNEVIFKGNMDYSGKIRIGAGYSSTTATLTLEGYDDVTNGNYNINEIQMNYSVGDNKRDTTLVFNMNDGAIAKVNALTFSKSISADNKNSTTVNLNGGVLTLGSVTFTDLADNSITINHSGTELAAAGNLNFGSGLTAGTLKYNLGENVLFNTGGYTIKIDGGAVLSRLGDKASITIDGGGDLVLSCDASAVNGDIMVKSGRLDLDTGWVSNASSITVAAGSAVETGGDIVLSSGSVITLGIAGENDYAWLTGASVTSSDGEYGKLIFDISASAFGDGSSLSFALDDLISASDVDWSKFDLSSNYEYQLGEGTITFVVPEPSTVGAAMGLLALCFAAYRRRR